MSLKSARTAAQTFLLMKVPSRTPTTLSEARTAFLAECEDKNRDATVRSYKLYLNQLTKEHLDEVTRADVPQKPHAIMAAKIFFNWCVRNELVGRNPFAGERVAYNQRSRLLSDEEIKQIWTYNHPPFSDHLKLLILTGQRRNQFTDFAIAGDGLVFTAEVMKGKGAHIIPLLPLARQHAEGLKPFNGWSKAKARIDKNVTIPPWVIHDIRRYFSTTMAKLKVPLHVTERILDHRSGSISGVAAIYNRHDFLEESREALALYEAHIKLITS